MDAYNLIDQLNASLSDLRFVGGREDVLHQWKVLVARRTTTLHILEADLRYDLARLRAEVQTHREK